MIPLQPHYPPSMFVTRAHLQAATRYCESAALRTFRRILPDSYGIAEMLIDDGALARGTLRFRKLDVRFQSGLPAVIDDTGPVMLDADVKPRLYGLTNSIGVSLAVPRFVHDGSNISADDHGARSTRFVKSLTANGGWIRPKLEIVFDGDPRDQYDPSEVLALGRIERVGHTLRFAPSTWPVSLHVHACDPLKQAVEVVLKALARRHDELLAAREADTFHLTLGAFPQDALELLEIVGAKLAALALLLDHPTARPLSIYEQLKSLYLSLAAFEDELAQPPKYEHDKLGDVIPWFVPRIVDLVDRVARQDVTWFAFERVDDLGTFALRFPPDAFPSRKRPVLVAWWPETAEHLVDSTYLRKLPALLKMAGPAAISSIKQSAVSGVRVKVDDDPPRDVPFGRGILAYTVLRRQDESEAHQGPDGPRSSYWTEIMSTGEVHLHVPDAPPPLQFYLYAVDSEG
ncbi:type VI secretion system baseplate subunit TssK [Pendulispora brunnea]|uniref:Type VI secretion system baseplate subunit TssK n=1 Tax=Pendulispora brunnea TaxID=2905690 RepID=A0ABZ2KKC0_9BACT